eukprot:m.919459 g.919459  ORF g.919459 m.919459 type:complete len:310 (-) comp23753_c0_seq1:1651-2580(-)
MSWNNRFILQQIDLNLCAVQMHDLLMGTRYERARPSALGGSTPRSIDGVTYDLGVDPQPTDQSHAVQHNEYVDVDAPAALTDHERLRNRSDELESDAATSPDMSKYCEVAETNDSEYLVPRGGPTPTNGGYAVPTECGARDATATPNGAEEPQASGLERPTSDPCTAAQQLSRELSALETAEETTNIERSQTSRTATTKGKGKRSKKKARSTKKEKKNRDTSGTPIKKSPTTRSSPNRLTGTPVSCAASTTPSPTKLQRPSRESGLYCSAEDIYDNQGRRKPSADAPGYGSICHGAVWLHETPRRISDM